MSTGRTAPWLALGAVVIAALVWAAWPDGGDRTASDRASELAAELRCPDCEGLSVADTSTSTARAIRRDIRTRIDAGQSDAEIRQAYVDRYGESILLKPEARAGRHRLGSAGRRADRRRCRPRRCTPPVAT